MDRKKIKDYLFRTSSLGKDYFFKMINFFKELGLNTIVNCLILILTIIIIPISYNTLKASKISIKISNDSLETGKNSLKISERILSISDPANSVFIKHVYFDINDRLIKLLNYNWQEYDYPIVIELFNTGNQNIIITGFQIRVDDIRFQSTKVVFDDNNRKYYNSNNLIAKEPTVTEPILLAPKDRVLIKSNNAINFKIVSDYVNSIDRNKINIFYPINHYTEPFWLRSAATDECSVPSLTKFLNKNIGEINVSLNLLFLNDENLFTVSIPLNNESKQVSKKRAYYFDFEQLLLDEVLIRDINCMIKKNPSYNIFHNEKHNASYYEKHGKIAYRLRNYSQIAFLVPILKRMGFDSKLFDNLLHSLPMSGFRATERWNPCEDTKR